MSRKTLLGLCGVLLLALITTTSLYSFAQTTGRNNEPAGPRITQQIDPRAYVTLPGNMRPEVNSTTFRGEVSAVTPMNHLLLFLQRSPEQEQALDQYIQSLNDHNSPNFHKWLTPEQLGDTYGVADEDIQQVTNWLQSNGFTINQVYPNKMVIDISGTAGALQQAFRTNMVHVEVNGEMHIANFSDPQIPAALAPVIKGFASLNNFRPHANHVPVTQYTFSGCSSSTAHPIEPGTCYAVTPQDNAVIYNLNPLWTAGYSGQGQTIAVVEDTDVYNFPGDWNTYRSTFGLSGFSGTFIQSHPSCSDPGTNADDGEAAIDVEVATGIAPSAQIELMSCPTGSLTFGGQIALLNRLNNPGPYPGVVSVSYGVCEAANGNGGNAAFYTTYQQAAAQGVSVFTSSGDEGASGCSRNFGAGANYFLTSLGVSGWGGTPYDVSVGGTDFEDVYNAKTGQNGGAALSTYWNSSNSGTFGSAKSYVPEIPWNDACASVLIAFAVRGSYNTYGANGTGFCNTSPGSSTSGYLSTAIAGGGASNCATGQGGVNTGNFLASVPQCQGYSKPAYQTGAALTGGQAVYGVPSDGVRDVPDVSMFAANGAWSHFETVCWSDPSQTSGGAASCAGAPSTWSGFGGTSVSSPTMAAIQALVNQKTGQTWGNPLSHYYQIGQNEYGTAGGTFQGTTCNASGTGGPGSGCVWNDVTQGDIDAGCRYNGTTIEHHCYRPATSNGVASTDNVTGATVINGGTGYTSAPTCTIAGPTNVNAYKSPQATTLWAGGTQATCTATINAGTTTAIWTVTMSAINGVGDTIVLSNNAGTTTCGPYTLSGASTTAMATNLVASIGAGCSLATAASSTNVVTLTARNSGYSGNFNTNFGNNGNLFQNFYVYITNTVLGQGPNYVSGITINTAGSGYQPETPITLTGVGNGAIAVANTTPGTAAQSYQPAFGANPGYDLATGLGTPNAYNLVCSGVWGSTCNVSIPTTTTVASSLNPSTYGQSVSFTATVSSGSGTPTGSVQFAIDSVSFGSPVTLNGSGQATSSSTSSLTAGTHTVTASYTPTGSFLASSGSLSGGQVVNQASQTITFTTDAPSSAVYGSQFTVAATGGGSGNPVVFTSAGACSNSGATYTMIAGTGTCSVIANQAGNSNYLPASQVTEFTTATKATLTVTANSTAITYGCACSPVLTYGITGFVGSDNQGNSTTGQPAESTAGTQGGPVGMYPITISQGTLTATNYTFTFVNGTLTVNPATLTVTADNKTATEGDGLPTFTATYSGFVNGDNQGVLSGAPSFSTDAPSGPPVGTWNIFVTQGTLAATNYVFSFVNGTLTVNPAVAQLTAPPKSTMLSGASVAFTWSHETNAVSYQLLLGSTPGGSDLASVTTANLTTTVNGLPTDGSYIYATLNGSTDGTNYTTQDSGVYVAYGPIAVMINPLPSATFTGSTVTFNWVPGAASSAYWIDVGSTPEGNNYYQSGNLGTALTATVNGLPIDGSTVYVTLWSLVGGNWSYNEYTYTAYNNGSTKGVITTPTPGSTLSGSSVLFSWTPGTQSTAYWIDAGSTLGGNQYFQSGNLGNVTSATVNGLPSDGSTVYITLWSLVGGNWLNNQYTYTAYSASGATGQITTPTPGSTLSGSMVVFNWTAGTGSSAYWLDAGSVPGGNQYYQSGNLGNVTTTTVTGLPTDGSTVYVTLYSLVGGNWIANSYTYTAFTLTGALGVMQTPTPGSTLSGNQATFTWSAGTGATAYWLDIGSNPGGNQYYQSGNLGMALSTTVYSLPADGSTIYVTLYSLVGGNWLSNAYTYTSGP